MPKKPVEMEKIIYDDGWILKSQVGSHRNYVGGLLCYQHILHAF